MALLVDELMEVIERLAPASLAEPWDNTGLQTGSRQASVNRVLLSLNLTAAVLEEAAETGCQAVVCHHPVIFKPLASASDDTEAGRLVRLASIAGVAVIAAHTNLDNAPGGLADILCSRLGVRGTKPLEASDSGWLKLVTFVPAADLDRVREALFAAGAGVIGDYRHCSYMLEGMGTFLPTEGAHPVIGEVGRDERVPETRLEMVFPADAHNRVIAALLVSHSYEEPAYDVYPLATRRRDAGSGRIGELESESTVAEFAGLAAEVFDLPAAAHTGDATAPVRRVALVPGGGAGMLGAAAKAGADVFVSGDFKYHDSLEAEARGIALVDIPHEVSESLALAAWLGKLEHGLAAYDVSTRLAEVNNTFWQSANRREVLVTGEAEEDSMFRLHVDGGSRGNPGPAAIGAVLSSPGGDTMDTLANYIGNATNNVAEYQALIAGVELALDRDVRRLAVFSDSELIVRQLLGTYKVKNEGLRPYYEQARSVLSRLERYELVNIPREANSSADALVNRALDESGH